MPAPVMARLREQTCAQRRRSRCGAGGYLLALTALMVVGLLNLPLSEPLNRAISSGYALIGFGGTEAVAAGDTASSPQPNMLKAGGSFTNAPDPASSASLVQAPLTTFEEPTADAWGAAAAASSSEVTEPSSKYTCVDHRCVGLDTRTADVSLVYPSTLTTPAPGATTSLLLVDLVTDVFPD
ncbi:hypothetical protein [Quadrisphaera setariae]|uniref:Uncharacterized protein n=2 Tax=Actinomycetes TaxID=1760 RepID=A0A5C8Z4C5_9ACTN|nr:hypothetical protein [Quadrisphaera setariae]TXR52427.1 hypothetical protein FMM08_19730 [Quadrisphaera setariae]